MALTRILGTAVRHPVATAATVAGVAKGTVTVVRRLARGKTPLPTPDEESFDPPVTTPESQAAQTEAQAEGQAAPSAPDEPDLPEPVVIYAEDEPEPVADPEGHVEVEEELVWTSESPQRSE